MKKNLCLMLCAAMLLSLAACAAPAAKPMSSETPAQTQVATLSPTEEPTPTPELIPTPEPMPKPADFLCEKYNPFFRINWPEGFKPVGYIILNGFGDEKVYNKSITYGIQMIYEGVDEKSVNDVITFLTELTGASLSVSDSVNEFQENYYLDFDGYIDELGSQVDVMMIQNQINDEPCIRIDMRVFIEDLSGYDINDYIEIIDLNFKEDIIPDWLGTKDLFSEQEPLYSTLLYSTVNFSDGDKEIYLSGSRDYSVDEKEAGEYIDTLSVYNDGYISGGLAMLLDFEFDEGFFEIGYIHDTDYITFGFYSDNSDTNFNDYNWELKIPE